MTNLENLKKETLEEYKKHFTSQDVSFFYTTGRIELLGNHTDHNHGKVLTAAIDRYMTSYASMNLQNKIHLVSTGYEDLIIDLNNDLSYVKTEEGTTKSLMKGVLNGFIKRGHHIGGLDIAVNSDITPGVGISSSAAFEVLIGRILSYFYNDNKNTELEIALIAQEAENQFFGKPCGLMDQCAISFGGINAIDFGKEEYPIIYRIKKLNQNLVFFLINTGANHIALTPYYASIKEDMKRVASFFNKDYLREIDKNEFLNNVDLLKEKYNDLAINRAIHFYEENERVEKAYYALIHNDLDTFLTCVNDSGKSSYHKLKNCYCENEDEKTATAIRKVASLCPNASVRIHGGGFAGSILVALKQNDYDETIKQLEQEFGKNNINLIHLV